MLPTFQQLNKSNTGFTGNIFSSKLWKLKYSLSRVLFVLKLKQKTSIPPSRNFEIISLQTSLEILFIKIDAFKNKKFNMYMQDDFVKNY